MLRNLPVLLAGDVAFQGANVRAADHITMTFAVGELTVRFNVVNRFGIRP